MPLCGCGQYSEQQGGLSADQGREDHAVAVFLCMDHIQRDNYCGDCRDRRSDCPFHVCVYLQVYGLQRKAGDSSVQKERLPAALYPRTGYGDRQGKYGGDPPDHFQQRGGGAGDGVCPHESEIQILQGASGQFDHPDAGNDHGVHGRG